MPRAPIFDIFDSEPINAPIPHQNQNLKCGEKALKVNKKETRISWHEATSKGGSNTNWNDYKLGSGDEEKENGGSWFAQNCQELCGILSRNCDRHRWDRCGKECGSFGFPCQSHQYLPCAYGCMKWDLTEGREEAELNGECPNHKDLPCQYKCTETNVACFAHSDLPCIKTCFEPMPCRYHCMSQIQPI